MPRHGLSGLLALSLVGCDSGQAKLPPHVANNDEIREILGSIPIVGSGSRQSETCFEGILRPPLYTWGTSQTSDPVWKSSATIVDGQSRLDPERSRELDGALRIAKDVAATNKITAPFNVLADYNLPITGRANGWNCILFRGLSVPIVIDDLAIATGRFDCGEDCNIVATQAFERIKGKWRPFGLQIRYMIQPGEGIVARH